MDQYHFLNQAQSSVAGTHMVSLIVFERTFVCVSAPEAINN